MPDISIPGVNSKYNTEEMIKSLVEAEKIPLKRMEETVGKYKTQTSTWRDVNQGLSRLRDSSRALFGFQSPFGERRSVSSDESILTATATREAAEGRMELLVKRVAANDKFLSRPLELDYSVPEGRYGFRVGEQEINFTFRGGKLSAFIQMLNNRSQGIVHAQSVRSTMDSQILMIEGTKTGAANALSFLEDAHALALNTGILEKDQFASLDVDLSTQAAIRPWTKPQSSGVVQDNALRLTPGREASIPFGQTLTVSPTTVLEMEVKVSPNTDRTPQSAPPPGPEIPGLPPASLEGVTVESSSSRAVTPEWTPPEAPPVTDDFSMLFANMGGVPQPLQNLEDTQDFVKLKIPLKNYGNDISALYFRNSNTHRELAVRNIRVYDTSERDGYHPANPVSVAIDAEMLMNGVPIQRPVNAVDDLLPGVTLNLQSAGPRPVEVRVEPDREKIKDALIQFVGYYNQTVANINILTRTDENIIQELGYLSESERDSAKEKLGLFSGDLTLMQIRNSFQNIMMSPYPTSSGEGLALLAQVGVSTNSRQGGGGGGYDVSRLRGYLEIDENLLDENLKKNLQGVRELFGSDTNGDLMPDAGAAVAMDNYIRPMVQTGGVIALKLNTLNSQISQTNRKIEGYNRYLENFEQNLKRKYGAMEGALGNLEKSSQAIENFNRNGSGNR
ncbi:MAG: flagellar filament capping protein FliD [Spirochaetales bacterium]|nr:flagellar filament capping protein FliD [Spirochaetales bacterium]